jgi:tetratricopeptide (TPR) repeat protein
MSFWFPGLLILFSILNAAILRPVAPQKPASPATAAVEVPKLESAAAQMEHAAKLKASLRGAKDEARKALTLEVVEAYRAVRVHWPESAEICAEAAFRAGELLRSSGDQAGAQTEFEFVRSVGDRTPLRARAGLELGHLQRRAKHADKALDLYLAVAADPLSEPERRDEAALWAGRVYAELGKLEEARRQWEAVAKRAEDPLQRIDAWDELAMELVDGGDLEGAAGWIAKAREALADVALEETARGERVRNALEHMRAIHRLERAIAARDKLPMPTK